VTGGPGPGSSRERRKRGRLSRSGDFDRVYKEGRSHGNRFLVLYAFPRSSEDAAGEDTRLGISVSRKVGGAVERNAVKRALREAFWSLDRELPASHDFVLVARPDLAGLIERDGTEGATTPLRELAAEAGLIGAAG
jgi:ribonuclease P protein component